MCICFCVYIYIYIYMCVCIYMHPLVPNGFITESALFISSIYPILSTCFPIHGSLFLLAIRNGCLKNQLFHVVQYSKKIDSPFRDFFGGITCRHVCRTCFGGFILDHGSTGLIGGAVDSADLEPPLVSFNAAAAATEPCTTG